MDYRDKVQRVINYVEARLEEPIDLADLSKTAILSAYHFARLFAVYTGLPPMSYVRRRKMMHAAHRISSGERILDVAIRYGYSSHGAFSRIFKGVMGFPPKECPTTQRVKMIPHMMVRTKRTKGKERTVIAYETEHLSIRNFREGDWEGIQQLARDLASSPAAHLDWPWPTSDQGCQEMETHFRKSPSFWAVCRRTDGQMLGVIVFNGVKAGALDFGHLFHSQSMSPQLALQAIQRMVQYVFDELEVERIVAHEAAAWPGQIEPLLSLGFRKVSEGKGTFTKDADEKPIEFLAYTLEMTRQEWDHRASG